ncbi:MAG: hypothetical protein NVSMB52_01720 [Chloroflexota bacterium]
MRLSALFPRRHHIVLGRTHHPLPRPVLTLSPQEQSYHATIWGQTGSGKSRLLQSLFLQHLAKGQGVAIIEPHHDLSFDTLTTLVQQGFFRRERAFKKLVYIDWGNGSYLPFNVLAAPGDPHTVALHVLEAMVRVWPELQQAPTFQTLFLSAMVVLIANQLPITSLYQLLSDGTFRRQCLERVTDPLIHQSFQSFEKIRDQVAEAGSALRRAFLISFNPVARLTLGQKENWLDVRRIMDEGRALIVNLGNIEDQETRRLIGALLLVQLEQAALSRTDLLPSERKPFTVLLDEWASFAAQEGTLGTILSQTRKFNLRLYLAAQSTSQISSARLAGALENCKLSIAFGLGRDSAAQQARQIAQVDPFAIKEEGLTETQHAQYLPIAEQFEAWTQDLQGLPPKTAYVKLLNRPPVKIQTLRVPDVSVPGSEMERVVGEYRRRYQRSQRGAEGQSGKHCPATATQERAIPAYTVFSTPSSAVEDSSGGEGSY